MYSDAKPGGAVNSVSFAEVGWLIAAGNQPRLPRPIAPAGLTSGVSARAKLPVIGVSHRPTNAAIEAPLTCQTVATPRCRTVNYPPRSTATPTRAVPTTTIEKPPTHGRSPLEHRKTYT